LTGFGSYAASCQQVMALEWELRAIGTGVLPQSAHITTRPRAHFFGSLFTKDSSKTEVKLLINVIPINYSEFGDRKRQQYYNYGDSCDKRGGRRLGFRMQRCKTHIQAVRANGGEPDSGRRLLSYALEAGIPKGQITTSASTWCCSTAEEVARWSSM
jgi:hypothetical protein